jgi:hypothetical protein
VTVGIDEGAAVEAQLAANFVFDGVELDDTAAQGGAIGERNSPLYGGRDPERRTRRRPIFTAPDGQDENDGEKAFHGCSPGDAAKPRVACATQ